MNTYKKIILALIIGLNIAPPAQAMNGNLTKLDQSGIDVIVELTGTYENFIKALRPFRKTITTTRFEEWNFLLKTNVKAYVENYSMADKKLMHNLNLLLQMNDGLLQEIKVMPDYYQVPDNKIHANELYILTEDIANPFEQIEQTIKNIIIPEIEDLSFYTAVDKKGKAKEILLRAFGMTHQIALAMINQVKAYRNKLLWIIRT